MSKSLSHKDTAKTKIKMANKMGLKMIMRRIPKIRIPIFWSTVGISSPGRKVALSFHQSNRSWLFCLTF